MTKHSTSTTSTDDPPDRTVKARQLPTLRGTFRRLAWVILGLALLTALIDSSMIVVGTLKVSDNATTAAFAGAAAAANKPIDLETAEIAFAAAQAQAQADGGNALRTGFALHADGSVTVTVVKLAPSILAGKLPFTAGLTELESTKTSKGPL